MKGIKIPPITEEIKNMKMRIEFASSLVAAYPLTSASSPMRKRLNEVRMTKSINGRFHQFTWKTIPVKSISRSSQIQQIAMPRSIFDNSTCQRVTPLVISRAMVLS